jgi:hypothetical protein
MLTLIRVAVGEAEALMAREYDKHAGMMAQLLDEPFQADAYHRPFYTLSTPFYPHPNPI